MGTPIAHEQETKIKPELCEEIIKGFEIDPRKQNISEGTTSLKIDDLPEWGGVVEILNKTLTEVFDHEYIPRVLTEIDSDIWFQKIYGEKVYLLHDYEIHRLGKNVKTNYNLRYTSNAEHFTFTIFLNTMKSHDSGGLAFLFSGNDHAANTGEILIYPNGLSNIYKMREISGEDEYSYFITGSFSDVEVDKDHDHHH